MKHRFGIQKKAPVSRSLVISVLSFLAAVFIFWHATGFVTDRTNQEESRILERAINRGIVHCYTIEGSYPENLQYLKDNYGLTYDEDRFFVDYQALGSNILPDVTIIDREEPAMKAQNHHRHVIHMLFPIALLFVFAVTSFMILTLAADIYASATDRFLVNDESRTALSYITEKVRQNDTGGAMGIADIDGKQCLSLSADYNGTVYVNYIYEYDGMLKELFMKEGADIPLKSGSDIIEISSLTVEELSGHMYRFTVVDSEGLEASMILSERSRP